MTIGALKPVSTALRTSLKHIFFEDVHKHYLLINTFAIALKQLPSPSPFGKHCLLNVRVTAATLESNTLV